MAQYQQNNCQIDYDEGVFKEVPIKCFEIEFWQQKNAVLGKALGRGITWFVQTDTLPAALRHYHRGGLIAKLNKDNYLFTGFNNTRAKKEYELLQYMHENGLAVPKPLAARAIRKGIFYQADILVEKIQDAKDLVARLKTSALTGLDYQKIGKLVRKMHDLGINHSDLNIHNILLDAKGEFWLIDFDKCSKCAGNGWKNANLERLLRSFRKELYKEQIKWQEANWNDLMIGYSNANF